MTAKTLHGTIELRAPYNLSMPNFADYRAQGNQVPEIKRVKLAIHPPKENEEAEELLLNLRKKTNSEAHAVHKQPLKRKK